MHSASISIIIVSTAKKEKEKTNCVLEEIFSFFLHVSIPTLYPDS
jgi:hypothetical protein